MWLPLVDQICLFVLVIGSTIGLIICSPHILPDSTGSVKSDKTYGYVFDHDLNSLIFLIEIYEIKLRPQHVGIKEEKLSKFRLPTTSEQRKKIFTQTYSIFPLHYCPINEKSENNSFILDTTNVMFQNWLSPFSLILEKRDPVVEQLSIKSLFGDIVNTELRIEIGKSINSSLKCVTLI